MAFSPSAVVCGGKQKAMDLHNVDVRRETRRITHCYILTSSLIRCGLAIIMASASMGSGTHGTMHRIRTGSFLTVLRLGFGTANPNAFTAYFLPKYACLPNYLCRYGHEANITDFLCREPKASSQTYSGPTTGRLSFHFCTLHTMHSSPANLSVRNGVVTQRKGKRFASRIQRAYSDRVISSLCR
jgi:hypothetical protein